MSMLVEPGRLFIDRYLVEEYLAEGGMQRVYLAKDLSFGRHVALKIPKNASAQKRFAQSARVSAKIVHPNVAKTLDYFEIEGKGYLIEEFIDGSDLSKLLLTTYEYFDPHLAAHLFHLITKGVAASHHAGVVHRDLKPNNVMVGIDANLTTVKVTDFGIARMAEDEIAEAASGGEASMSNSTTAMGALPYMAPEMIEKPRLAGTKADVWALGAILYRLISGEYPFGKGWGAMRKILKGELPRKPPIISMRPEFASLANQLWSIILDCMRPETTKRPTADDLVTICGELCYSDRPRTFGTIRTYGSGTGAWGYLDGDNGADVFFHINSYYGKKPVPETRVSYSACAGDPCDRAFPVLPLRTEKDREETS